MTMNRYCISRAAIEYSHAYIEADSPEEAVRLAKEEWQDWVFDSYASDGVLEELTTTVKGEPPAIVEYEVTGEPEPAVCEECKVEGGHRADCKLQAARLALE